MPEKNIIKAKAITAPGIEYPREISWLIILLILDFDIFSVY